MTKLTSDWLGSGAVINVDQFALAADRSTTSTAVPPTEVLFSDSYTKLSSSSVLYVSANVYGFNSASSCNSNYLLYYNSTAIQQGRLWHPGTYAVYAAPLSGKVSGLSAGAVTVGVKWSTSAGTFDCKPVTYSYLQCVIDVIEVEP